MTVSSNYTVLKELGNGTTVDFSGLWNALDESYLVVYLEDATTGIQTLQTYTTHYTAVVSDSGFTVTFVTAPTSSYYVVIGVEVPLSQTSPYKTSKGYQGAVLETSLDKLTIIAQQQQDALERAIVAPMGSTGGEMPTDTARAGKYLAFDSSGSPIALSGVASISTSTTSVTIATGTATLTLDNDGQFIAGQYVVIASRANSANYMYGTITSFSDPTLVVNVTAIGGSGTKSDWNIGISGPIGPTGATGASGSGSGDMVAANNLSDLADSATAQANLGLKSAATLDYIDEDDMASDSDTKLPTQQSVKAYVDTQVAAITSGVVAWVDFNGTGTPSINASYNVDHITDNGTGDYTINFTSALTDANYAMSGCAGGATGGNNQIAVVYGATVSKTDSACRIKTVVTSNGVLNDCSKISVIFVR